MDCDRAFGNAGCKGGLPSQAFAYVKHNGGIATKDNYASVAEERACKFRPEDLSVNVLDSVTAVNLIHIHLHKMIHSLIPLVRCLKKI